MNNIQEKDWTKVGGNTGTDSFSDYSSAADKTEEV